MDRKQRVLVLYGGENATAPRNELVSWIATKKALNAEPFLVAGSTPHSEGTVSERVKEAIDRADKAIALVTLDERSKYGAPNVQEEIGRWIQARGGRTLCVIRQKGTDINSNAAGLVYLHFDSRIREAFDELRDFIAEEDYSDGPQRSRSPATRGQLIARRWRAITTIAILVFALTFVIGKLESAHLSLLAARAIWAVPVIGASVLSYMIWAYPKDLIAALGLRHPLSYPPYWLGIALGLSAAIGTISRIDILAIEFELSTKAATTYSALSSVLLVIPFALIVSQLAVGHLQRNRDLAKRKSSPESQNRSQLSTPTSQQLRNWIYDDNPVHDPSNDWFGHSVIAERMATRLDRQLSAQALVGPLGSGKSTVRELVKSLCQQKQYDFEIICIELWPYESARAAVEGILAAVVDVLSREASTAKLDGIPALYGQAVAKAGGLSDWLPRIDRKQTPPGRTLESLDEVATILKRRYVLWVEDLERFAAGEATAPVSDSEIERLAPIRALLHGLDQLRSMAVVTATTNLFRRFDIEKIARYVETIPNLSFRLNRKTISIIRHQLLNEHPFLDPALSAARESFRWSDSFNSEDEAFEIAILGDRITSFSLAVSALAITPRTLKQGLRRSIETWNDLRGEIDLDEVIALCILREAKPDVFALLEKNISSLQTRSEKRKEKSEEPIETFGRELRKILSEDSRTVSSIINIVEKIFGDNEEYRPQSIRYNNHTNYWQRFLTGAALPEDEQDQQILRIINNNNTEELIDILASSRSAAMEHFSRLISPQRLIELLVPLTVRLLHEDITQWKGSHPPGLISLWRMLRKHIRDSDNTRLASATTQALMACVSKNLVLFKEIGYWITTHTQQLPGLLTKSQREIIHNLFHELLLKSYTDQPLELSIRLRGANPFLLYQICWISERTDLENTTDRPFADWPRLAKTLLDALSVDAAAVAPQIAVFITRLSRRLRGPDVWIFDKSQCELLFGDPTELRKLIADATVNTVRDPRIHAVVEQSTATEINEYEEEQIPEFYWSDIKNGEPHSVEVSAVRDESNNVAAKKQFAGSANELHNGSISEEEEMGMRIKGYFFDSLEAIPLSQPESPSFYILPEKNPLREGSLCLLLVSNRGQISPLSEAAISSYPHFNSLSEGKECFFAVADSWPKIYRLRLDRSIGHNEVGRRFGSAAGSLARRDKATVVVEAIHIPHTPNNTQS